MKRINEFDGLDLLASKNIRLSSCRIWLRRSNKFPMPLCIREIALARKDGSPAICIAFIDAACIEKEVREVVYRIYPEIPAGQHKREIEDRDVCTALCNIEEKAPVCW